MIEIAFWISFLIFVFVFFSSKFFSIFEFRDEFKVAVFFRIRKFYL